MARLLTSHLISSSLILSSLLLSPSALEHKWQAPENSSKTNKPGKLIEAENQAREDSNKAIAKILTVLSPSKVQEPETPTDLNHERRAEMEVFFRSCAEHTGCAYDITYEALMDITGT